MEKELEKNVELITKAAPEKVFQTSLSIIKLWDAEKLISLFLFVMFLMIIEINGGVSA